MDWAGTGSEMTTFPPDVTGGRAESGAGSTLMTGRRPWGRMAGAGVRKTDDGGKFGVAGSHAVVDGGGACVHS